MTDTNIAETKADTAPMLTTEAPPARSLLSTLTREEIASLTESERLELEEDHRQWIRATSGAADAKRAEINKLIALQWPDETELARENLHPQLVQRLEAEAESAFHAAKSGPGSGLPWSTLPASILDKERADMHARSRTLVERVASYRAYAARWRAIAALPEADRRVLATMPVSGAAVNVAPHDPSSKLVAAMRGSGAQPATGNDALRIIAQRAQQGIRLTVVGDDIEVSPAGLLDPEGRRQIRQFKSAILAALKSSERI